MSNQQFYRQIVQRKCAKAVQLSTKNFKKGLKLANKLCSQYRANPNVYTSKAEILIDRANTLGDTSNEKQKLLRKALEAAQFSAALAPKDPYFTYYHATVLYELANDEAAYSRVIKVCHDALQMQPDECLIDDINDVINDASNGGKEKLHRGVNQNPVKPKPPVARANVDREYAQQEVERQKRWVEKSREKRATPDQEFIAKNGEYWRKSSFNEKCEILDVSVEDLESFFAAGDNKNSRAASVCREAVEWYKRKGHWVTWACCLCGEDEFDDCCALEEHMDDVHFNGYIPKITGNLEVNVLSDADDLGLDDNGRKFILDKQGLVGWLGNDKLANEVFLLDWLRPDSDIEMALARWDNKKMEGAQAGMNVSEKIEELTKQKFYILMDVKELQQKNMGSSEQLEDVHQECMEMLECFGKLQKGIESTLGKIEVIHKKREESLKNIEDIRPRESMGNLGQPEGQQQDSIGRLEKVEEEKQPESTKSLDKVEEEKQQDSIRRLEKVEEGKQPKSSKCLEEFEEEQKQDSIGRLEKVEEEKQPESTNSLDKVDEEQQQDSIRRLEKVKEGKQPKSSKSLEEFKEEQKQDSIGSLEKLEEENQTENTKSLDKIEEEQQQDGIRGLENVEEEKQSESSKSLDEFEEEQKQDIIGSLEKVEEEKQPESTKSLDKVEEQQQQDDIRGLENVEEERQPESSKSLDEFEEEQKQDSTGSLEKVEEETQQESTKSLDEVEEEQKQESMKSLEKVDEQQKPESKESRQSEELQQESIRSLKQQQGKIDSVENYKEMERETSDLQKIPTEQKHKKNLEKPEETQSKNESKGKSIQDKRKTPEIKMYREKVVSEISSLDAKLIAFKRTAMRHSAFDYREALMPIIKSFIQARLNSKVEEAARKRAPSAMEDLVGKIDNEEKTESNKSKKNKKKGEQ